MKRLPLTAEQRELAASAYPASVRIANSFARRYGLEAEELLDAAVDATLNAARKWRAGEHSPFAKYSGGYVWRWVMVYAGRLSRSRRLGVRSYCGADRGVGGERPEGADERSARPDRLAAAREAVARLLAAVDRMPEGDQTLLRGVLLEGHTCRDLIDAGRLPGVHDVNAARLRLRNARKKLAASCAALAV